MLTVPLLVLVGVPGDVANGTNRLGILTSNVSAAEEFRRQGVAGLSRVVPVLVPVVIGALVGSVLISRVDAGSFERVFGVLMVPLLLLSLRPPQIQSATHLWSARTAAVLFFVVGLYAGAFQAGIGLLMMPALARAGLDVVVANNVKVLVVVAVTCTALPVFIAGGLVDLPPPRGATAATGEAVQLHQDRDRGFSIVGVG